MCAVRFSSWYTRLRWLPPVSRSSSAASSRRSRLASSDAPLGLELLMCGEPLRGVISSRCSMLQRSGGLPSRRPADRRRRGRARRRGRLRSPADGGGELRKRWGGARGWVRPALRDARRHLSCQRGGSGAGPRPGRGGLGTGNSGNRRKKQGTEGSFTYLRKNERGRMHIPPTRNIGMLSSRGLNDSTPYSSSGSLCPMV